ncbi:methyl-accepting chemotaxis protein [Parasalinivibrio latis]|uniref:methyl-accepting chemotaxis protein n=1 Tax=Parasalinivibrio latis TaxID=2952610 RepID=UPI0030DF3E9D
MELVKNLSVRNKLLIIVGLAVSGLIALTVIQNVNHYHEILEERKQHLHEKLEIALHVLEAGHAEGTEEAKTQALTILQEMHFGESGYFFAIDDNDKMIVGTAALRNKDFSTFRDLNGKNVLASLRNVIRQSPSGAYDSYVFHKPGSKEPIEKVSVIRQFPAWGLILGTGIYIDDIRNDVISDAISSGTMTLVMALVLVLLAWQISLQLIKPVKSMKNVLKLVSSGDLTTRATITSHDEIGQMGEHLNAALNNLCDLLRHIEKGTVKLDSNSRALKALADTSTQGIQKQSLDVDSAASAMEEMSSSVKEVENSTHVASENAQKATSMLETANNSLDIAISQFTTVNSDIQHSAQTIEKLALNTDKIGEVVTVINNISEQTNLLALNAAIEAARAGEAGRGFAVVADEVRKLAHSTRESTEQITDIINELQGSAQNAVARMKTGTRQTAESLEQAKAVDANMKELATLIGELQTMNLQIAASSTQQSSVAEEIACNMASINDVFSDTRRASVQSLDLSEDVAGLSKETLAQVQKFTIRTAG